MLTLRAVSKQFPGVVANDSVSFGVATDQIHAIVGENGAGKSTLMRIIYGLDQPDSGSMLLCGKAYRPRSAVDAIASGVGMVHQHFKLFPSLTAAENICLGAEPTRAGLIDRAALVERVAELCERYGLGVDPLARVGDLPVGVRQRVELLKALWRNARLLILDEPTAVLTPTEVDQFLSTVATLAQGGRSVLIVTHKLREVMAVADVVTIMRHGRVVAELDPQRANTAEMTRRIVGHELQPVVAPPVEEAGETILELQGVRVVDRNRATAVRDVSFSVRRGEIVGIAGVSGNGQTELIQAIVGRRQPARGTIEIVDGVSDAEPITSSPRFAYIPDDRLADGAALDATVAENMAMGRHRSAALRRGPWIDRQAVIENAESIVFDYDVRTIGVTKPFRTLSGGNQQKAVLGRELHRPRPLIIAEHPTRGLDVEANELIQRRLFEARSERRAVLLVSAELSELMTLCDRILVMFEGAIVGEFARPAYDEQRIGAMMAGLPVERP